MLYTTAGVPSAKALDAMDFFYNTLSSPFYLGRNISGVGVARCLEGYPTMPDEILHIFEMTSLLRKVHDTGRSMFAALLTSEPPEISSDPTKRRGKLKSPFGPGPSRSVRMVIRPFDYRPKMHSWQDYIPPLRKKKSDHLSKIVNFFNRYF